MARRNIAARTPLTHPYEKIHKEALDLYCSMPVARYKAVAQAVGIKDRTIGKWAKEEELAGLARRARTGFRRTNKEAVAVAG